MNLQLYFAPGACSFVPHVGLEAAGAPFEPGYLAYAERALQAPPVAAPAARERIRLDTYKA